MKHLSSLFSFIFFANSSFFFSFGFFGRAKNIMLTSVA